MFLPNALPDREIIGSEYAKLATAFSKGNFALTQGKQPNSEYFKTADQMFDVWSFFMENAEPEQRESLLRACQLNHNHGERISRLKKRISKMLSTSSKTAFFVTLTFDDDAISRTNETSRRKAVLRVLGALSADYVGNIDFGAKNGREHYHAVCLVNDAETFGDELRNAWKSYGFSNVQRVRLGDDVSTARLAKYVAKLANHAVKETAQSRRCIYCRTPQY